MSAPITPMQNPTISSRLGIDQSFMAYITTRIRAVQLPSAATGPAGPLLNAFYIDTMPTVSNIDPMRPTEKR
jgi:hypothetical protein